MGCVGSKSPSYNARGGKKPNDGNDGLHHANSLRQNLMWSRKLNKFYERYEVESSIGEGSLGAIRAVRKISTNERYAMKTIMFNRVSKSMIKELENEIEILKSLDHPNIIRCTETYKHKRNLILIMEICDGADLYSRSCTESQTRHIMRQICSAIAYCHRNNICHRDIKFENILYESKKKNAAVKLIDFGLSERYNRGHVMNRVVGTIYTMAPEVLNGSYTQACDNWSIGVVAFMLLSGTLPFPGKNDEETISLIQSGNYTVNKSAWEHVSPEAMEFVKGLLMKDPTKRWTMDSCLNSEWLSKKDGTQEENIVLPSRDSSADILASVQRFSTYGNFKRTALMVLAYNFDQTKLSSLRDAFHLMDTEKTGTLSLKELREAFEMKGIEGMEVERLFKELDQDKSGKIHYMEFLAATLETCNFIEEEKLVEAFDRLDSDDSGYITKKNLKEILGPMVDDNTIQQMIEEADVKKNGKIDFEEFLKHMRITHQLEVQRVVPPEEKADSISVLNTLKPKPLSVREP